MTHTDIPALALQITRAIMPPGSDDVVVQARAAWVEERLRELVAADDPVPDLPRVVERLLWAESSVAENVKLFKAIKEHYDQREDDRCWQDDQKLYAAAGLPPNANNCVGDKFKMLHNCIRFVDQRCSGSKAWTSRAELESEVEQLRDTSRMFDAFVDSILATEPHISSAKPITEALLDKVKECQRLQAENARLREALQPFADIYQTNETWHSWSDNWEVHHSRVTVGIYRRAAAALLAAKKEANP